MRHQSFYRLCIIVLGLIASATFAVEAEFASGSRTVTLITGDQIVVHSNQSMTMQPRSGRKGVAFVASSVTQRGSKKHVYVIPSDAVPLIGSGKLDKELFNVTALVDSQFDLEHRPDLPLLLTYESQSSARTAVSAKVGGLSRSRALTAVNAVSAKPSIDEVGELWDSLVGGKTAAKAAGVNMGLKKIWLDAVLKPVLDRSTRQIRADTAWAAGYEGTGVRVAIVDTGVDATHPDLAGKVISAMDFSGGTNPNDDVGHGTHVASIVAGSGAASGGQYRGVAPGASLISAKVCFTDDAGQANCLISDVIEGAEWAVIEQHAKIVNISLGGNDSVGVDPLEDAVNQLTANYGALFVIAAGNSGPGPQSIASPGSADAALTVAAVDRADVTASFSSRGPRYGDDAIKPDVSAPGVGIVAARATGTALGTPLNDRYTALNGTSMATPHVTGAAALLSQRRPDLNGAQLKAVLTGAARSSAAIKIFEQGAGRVDVETAFAAAVMAQPVSLSFGTALWPHDDDPGIVRDVTFNNVSNTNQTLTFRFEVFGPDGGASPETFSISPATLTIPANGSASARVTANMRAGNVYGLITGRLIAAANSTSVSVPVAVHREVESYDLTLRGLDTEGNPAWFTSTAVRTDAQWSIEGTSNYGEAKIRLPKGRYAIDSLLLGADRPFALIMHPTFFHGATETLTFDSRDAKAIDPVSPTANAVLLNAQLNYVTKTSYGLEYETLFLEYPPSKPPLLVATVGDSFSGLRSDLTLMWGDKSTVNPATQEAETLYSGGWVTQGRLPAPGTRALPQNKLAVLRSEFLSPAPEITQGIAALEAINGGKMYFWLARPTAFPAKRTAYFYSEGDVRWRGHVSPDAGEAIIMESATNQYLAGRSYSERWMEPLFMPALPESVRPRWVFRTGDSLRVSLPPFGDRQGNSALIGDYTLQICVAGECIACSAPFCGGFRVPAEPYTYTLESFDTQSVYSTSTNVHSKWTFDSEHVNSGDLVQPLLTMRVFPELNKLGQALRGKRCPIPLTVFQVGTLGPAEASAVTVEASFDDGASWRSVPVKRNGKQWIVEMSHPAQGDFVSLRLSAQGAGNNRVDETIIRAYGLMDAATH